MANEYNVKQWRPGSITFSQNMSGNSITIFSSSGAGPGVINGQILEVDFRSNGVGSIFVTRSGLGQEIFRRNAPSGLGATNNWQFAYPRIFGELTTGSVTASTMQNFNCAEPLIFNIAAGSNTAISGTFVDIIVNYR